MALSGLSLSGSRYVRSTAPGFTSPASTRMESVTKATKVALATPLAPLLTGSQRARIPRALLLEVSRWLQPLGLQAEARVRDGRAAIPSRFPFIRFRNQAITLPKCELNLLTRCCGTAPRTSGPAPDKAASQFAHLRTALSSFERGKAMLNPKTCREHASKCTQRAETFPPGEQRQKFLDMAADWTRLAATVEDLEASSSQAPANANEPYRFGSRIYAQQLHERE